MNTSYLYITPRSNWDSHHRKAIDHNLVEKKTYPWNTTVDAIKPGELSNRAQLAIQDFDKDIYDIILNNVDYKVINVVSKPEPADHSHSGIGNQALTQDVVRDVANKLIDANGSTTNLDVKNELRKRGYWAIQADVSDFMQSIASSIGSGWDVSNNGRFNTYSLKSTAAPAQNTPAQSPARKQRKPRVPGKVVPMIFFQNLANLNDINTEGKQLVKAAIDGKQLNTTNFMDTKDIWVVYCPTTKDVALYEPDFSSDDVRNAFRKVIKVQMQATRARRYKNIQHWKIN